MKSDHVSDVFFDEMFGATSLPRDSYLKYSEWLKAEGLKNIRKKQRESEHLFRLSGITFNVYVDGQAQERLIPFDIIPRIISSAEWVKLKNGIEQRVRAINSFLYDIYHHREIVKAGVLPEEMVSSNNAFLPRMINFDPPFGVYTHIAGIDIVRTAPETFYVLEDNIRTPSGVSYMLENRETMLHMFPELFSINNVQAIENYPIDLLRSLCSCAPTREERGVCAAVLTPGVHNSAFFEHAFLADKMGIELVEGADLLVTNGRLTMKTTAGLKEIDVLYRRVDDEFLDPLNFNPASQLGVPGLFDIYRAGAVTIANAPGSGIADDKAIYAYLPEIIEFYTGSPAILKNVPTWICSDENDLKYVVDNLDTLVVKEVHGSGGYGMLIGPAASKTELAAFKRKLLCSPHNYIAQPTLSLSTVPVLTRSGLAPRHVDLRPFALVSPGGISITPGGLTRVALKKNSLIVNSSQGGGTKDTWVLVD